jgi:rhamnosyltransferase
VIPSQEPSIEHTRKSMPGFHSTADIVGVNESTIDKSSTSPRARQVTAKDVTAVVVSYKPDGGLPARLRTIGRQVGQVIVVDNGSGPSIEKQLRSLTKSADIQLILNGANLGVATALNQGLEAAKEAGYEWALTLDQDSVPANTMVSHQLDTLNSVSSTYQILCVCPNVYSAQSSDPRPWGWLLPHERHPYLFRIVRSTTSDIRGVTLAITSGALTNLRAFETLGPFRDEYFIDYVDTEYCLRAKQRGYTILVSARARLDQKLGNAKEIRFLGRLITPTFHSPLRRYYIQRNRIPTIRRFATIYPHWFLFDLLVNSFHHVLILLFEDQKLHKLWASIKGTWDGLRGRLGPR